MQLKLILHSAFPFRIKNAILPSFRLFLEFLQFNYALRITHYALENNSAFRIKNAIPP